jgi:hypothetical protein
MGWEIWGVNGCHGGCEDGYGSNLEGRRKGLARKGEKLVIPKVFLIRNTL